MNDDASADETPGDETPADAVPSELGHVHLKVRDVDRAVEFYRDVVGLSVAERYANYAFLSFGDHHHDVALQAVGPDASGPGMGVGLYHAAFEVPSAEALRLTAERLSDRGVEFAPVDHRISKALYFEDPDGNGVEVYLDTREDNDRTEWDGENRRFDPQSL
ncbi:VOC family protein [Halopelagius longus]|uniref:Biphenyl-2,3-diol 1,2-dioxygenase n=1 Tax=Halopelagius longus TaxID=1236180 RepID=A0A1H1DH21_9EURY|nr:VOC family protein [Halopelagius longus]RDI71322.1 biphenyl-2,3-diol 1,2-dioxygenase [Halopelagius longus]SDQ75519.1 catechol 2,3-dioxygenase [Halopelagius longus]